MNLDRAVMAFAGIMILVSTLLTLIVIPLLYFVYLEQRMASAV